jgi:hypothetical protein
MSSWHPNDLVSDQDLVDYESTILTKFGQTTWLAKRTKALEDWLYPVLRANGFAPQRLRTRFEADQVFGCTAGVYGDYTAAASSQTEDDLDLATIITTPATDALYVGSQEPFRGLFCRLADAVSTSTATLAVAYWSGAWKALTIMDGTIVATGKTLSGGGAVTWALPADWSPRAVNGSVGRYWVKVTANASPAGAKAGQMAVLRASLLRAAAALRTLHLIMAEAPTGADGPWQDKADYYGKEAGLALERVLPLIGGEFDTDESEQISSAEADQTSEQVGGGWRLERA